ncbi:MAG: hydroxyacid dehydrogenase [Actinomycetia bacterium]|nr:hydroxyacid dehydrogenase [Actinomycetes bacterium]
MLQAVLAARPEMVAQVLVPDDLEPLAAAYQVDTSSFVTDWSQLGPAELAAVEVVVSGWGSPLIDASVLDRMPALRAVCHAAGTVRFTVTREVLERGVAVSSAAWANALPVAEYTVAMILLAAKRTLLASQRYREARTWRPDDISPVGSAGDTGTYRAEVGIISASLVGRRVLALLEPYDLVPLLYDPYVSAEGARRLGAEKVELAELFRRCQVVSLHTPDLPATRGMITAELLGLMRPGATFINTARPLVVDQEGLRQVLRRGEVSAVLDVTWPEPLPADDELWDLPNVLLTPHWAGSAGNEQRRLGRIAVEEALRVARGEPLAYPVHLDRWDITA